MKRQFFALLTCLIFVAGSTPVVMADLIDGLVAFWPMEETAGNIAGDATGNGHDGTLENGPTWTQADVKMGKGALAFDGSDDRIVVESFDVADGTGITLAAWIKLEGFNDDTRIISKAEGGGTPEHYWALLLSGNGENDIECRLRTDVGATSRVTVPDGQDVVADVWTHVAVTWDASDPNIRFYKDGQEIHVVPKAGGAVGEGPGVKIGIGNQSVDAGAGNMDRPFHGILDDVAIWNRGLTPEELSEMMTNGIPLPVEASGKLTTTWSEIKVMDK